MLTFIFPNQYELILECSMQIWYYVWIVQKNRICQYDIQRDIECMSFGILPSRGVVLIYREKCNAFAYFIKHSRRIPAIAFMLDGTVPLKIKWMHDIRSYNEYLALAKE